ncbi:hypothetical protein EDB81DRAFT_771952 [Dactylonectria macrodidyma]|uniref:NACHT domain-containing protein n=1 Tax=Dactylonectria macrodidyma TaxID=307937 RepID=A0A9P9JNH8_9HYPO|nr:hypothetical protein EDB81DRAFT_771952 [Dactylonectria macrodidyma]
MDSQSLPHIPSSRGDASNASLQEKIACTIREARQGEPPKDVFIKDVWPILEVDYKTMVRELVEFCKNKLREKRITCNVTGRAKSRDSISESLHRREKHLMEQQNKQYESLRDILNDIHDLAGIRIVVDFPSDIDNVSSFIQETFRQVKEPNVFSPDRRVSDVWQPLFGAYKTCNYRVEVKLGTEGALSQYCGVMFEIQLTDLSESLYNRFAHPFLYKKSSDQLDRQDEIVVDMSHGIALLYSLCLVYMQDRLESSASYIDEKDKLLGAMRQAEAEGNLDALLQTMPEVPGSDVENHTVASADRSLKRRPSFRGTVPIRVLTKALETSEEGCNSADALWALLINKFRGPECEDDRHVADADAWIRDKHYNTGRLKIERLSGDLLSMDQCYINLAIVEQPGGMAGRSDTAQPSPFSLLARQKVETPEKTIQVELATIFNQRKGCDGRMIQPRRILIRGRAGVGKTTLCKKMVYDFTCDPQTRLHRSWTELFDRLLWVPLRHLKGRSAAGYNYEDLFHHEYFSRQGHDHGRRLAKALWRTVDTHSDRTLFILDGLDEIYDDLAREDDMSRFLTDLLNQRNVIITSRPNASFPALRDLDLELETIGFYPDQVQAYLEADPKIKPRANEVQSFLRDHWLLQGLVRIPIQLDALCYTWDDFDPGTAPDTMTHIYQAIERRLWKKDAVRLDKMCKGHARSARPTEIERRVKTEIALLESLAFNGLHSDVIDFTPAHRDEIVDMFPLSDLPLDEALARVSFLRTSDSSSKVKDRNYHFIHLTFQEYFAARYFIQQWTSGEQLSVLKLSSRQERSRVTKINAEEFLRKEKYNARYGIFWRFVAGLLHANSDEGQLCRFFRTIEEQPRDLLGPVHQRLVMHCLSEVVPSQEIPEFITGLQEQLNQWLVFEYTLLGRSNLARELEFPDQILEAVLRDKSEDGFSGGLKRAVLDVFRYHRKTLPEPALDALVALLKDTDSKMRRIVAEALGRQSALSEPALEALVAILKDADSGVRRAAAEALSWQSALSEPALNALVALLKDADWRPQYAAAKVLGSQSALSEPVLDALVALLKDTDLGVRRAAAEALGQQSALSEPALEALVALLKDADSDVRCAAAEALSWQSALSEPALNALMALLKDADWGPRHVAAEALGSQSALPALSDERFCSFLLIMDSQSFNNLYSVWLKRSFSDHLIWYIEGKKCRLNVPEGGRDVPFNQLIHQLKSAVQKAQVSLKVPEDSILKDV